MLTVFLLIFWDIQVDNLIIDKSKLEQNVNVFTAYAGDFLHWRHD